jgi:hypothetical protein
MDQMQHSIFTALRDGHDFRMRLSGFLMRGHRQLVAMQVQQNTPDGRVRRRRAAKRASTFQGALEGGHNHLRGQV